jgi:glycosyltransferase involved in cell wall biosynthesis
VLRIYRGHYALLFPSLHDAAGMDVLEAFAAGLPVVCFNLGGPGVLVDDRVGRVVDVSATTYDEAVNRLAAALRSVTELNVGAYRQLSLNALERARSLVSDKVVHGVYGRLEAPAEPVESRVATH